MEDFIDLNERSRTPPDLQCFMHFLVNSFALPSVWILCQCVCCVLCAVCCLCSSAGRLAADRPSGVGPWRELYLYPGQSSISPTVSEPPRLFVRPHARTMSCSGSVSSSQIAVSNFWTFFCTACSPFLPSQVVTALQPSLMYVHPNLPPRFCLNVVSQPCLHALLDAVLLCAVEADAAASVARGHFGFSCP